MAREVFQGLGIRGVVFILITMICLFLFNIKPLYSILIGLVGVGVVYLIKFKFGNDFI
jgi:hypothetical protein